VVTQKKWSESSSNAMYAMQSQAVIPVVEEVGAGPSVGGVALPLSLVEDSTASTPSRF
jgi:hypothetical protein